MFFRGPGADEHTAYHKGFVAGRYRDESCSDVWTDVSRCAAGTFVSFLAACACGWRGPEHPATSAGYHACQRAWVDQHFGVTVVGRHRRGPGSSLPRHLSDADFDWGNGLQRFRDTQAWAEAGRAAF